MSHKRRLFFAEAFFQKVRNYILNIISVAIIIYCAFHFTENPVTISVIIICLIFSVLVTGNSQIEIFDDRIEFILYHPINFFRSKRIIYLNDIQSIEADLRLTKKGFILFEIMSSYLPGFSIFNTLHFKLKDGKIKTIKTSVYQNEVVKALEIVKSITKNQISIRL